jgi:hypothetical protein
MTVTKAPAQEPILSARAAAATLARTMSAGAIAGGVAGFVVGGVLGRLAMRLLAITSPASAQGLLTDDQAIVGRITLGGTLDLALFTTVVGVIGGLIYVWVRRVLPFTLHGRVLGFGIFASAIGGALFVHEHPSFDYTVLAPAWLAVALFVTLPALFGVATATLVEMLDRPSGRGRRAPWWAVVGVGLLLSLPTLPLTAPVIVVAFVVALVPALQRLWRSRAVTLIGSGLFVVLVLWGLYGLVVDVISIARDQASGAPFNL